MQRHPFWPLVSMTDKQNKAYDNAFDIAVEYAGGSLSRLATEICLYTGEYISHQAFRNWKAGRNIPVHWALVIEKYTDGEASFFDFIPWMAPHVGRWHMQIEQQINKVS